MKSLLDSASVDFRLNRRALLKMLASGAGMAVLAACGTAQPSPTTGGQPGNSPSGEASSPRASGPANGSAQPKPGGTLRLGFAADVGNLDGHVASPVAYETVWLAFDRLTAYDDKLQPQPMLAESWDLSSDAKQIKLNLRKGVQFHTGREFTSADVKWNVLRGLDPKAAAGRFQAQSKWFSNIETPDKYTIVLKSDEPRPLVFDWLENLNILDQQTMEGPDAKTKLVGTGPFTFVEWKQGVQLRFVKNKNYWQSGRPYVDELQANILPDPQAMVAQLEAGSVDVIKLPPLREFARLKSDPKYQAFTNSASGQTYVIGANVKDGPTANKKVRQALSYAIDRKRFVDSVILATGTPESLPWKPYSPAFDEAKNGMYGFDLAKSSALLKEAGVSNLEMDLLLAPTYPELFEFAQIFQADAGKAGIKINVRKLENEAFFDQINNVKYRGLWINPLAQGQLHPGWMFANSRGYDPLNNNSGYKSDQYSKLVKEAESEPDPGKLKQVYSQLNDLMLDECFVMFISPGPPRLAARSTVHGISQTLHEGFSFTEAWLG